jgi:hypothetical protein
MTTDEGIDYTITWASPVARENKEPATAQEIIDAMSELRRRCASTTLDSPAFIRARHEVIKEIAKQLEEREQGFCIVNFNEDGPRFDANKGFWESGLHVFATEGAMHQWMVDF